MCLAVPGQIQSHEGEGILREGMVQFGPLSKKVNLAFVPEVKGGDFVLVHAGVAGLSAIGAAAVLVGVVSYQNAEVFSGNARIIHEIEIIIGSIVGAVTSTGSIIAFGKLNGIIGRKPFLLPLRHLIDLLMLITCFVLGAAILAGKPAAEMDALIWIIILSSILGVHMIMVIGGADMPRQRHRQLKCTGWYLRLDIRYAGL